MHRRHDTAIYYATAPIRLFGRSRAFRLSLAGVLVAGGSFYAALWALDRFMPAGGGGAPPSALAKLPPLPDLPPVTRASYVIAPVAVALSAIRASLDAAAPRELVSQNGNPVSSLLSKADIGMTVTRGPLGVTGKPNDLAIVAPLNSSMRVTGQIAGVAGDITGSITGLRARPASFSSEKFCMLRAPIWMQSAYSSTRSNVSTSMASVTTPSPVSSRASARYFSPSSPRP